MNAASRERAEIHREDADERHEERRSYARRAREFFWSAAGGHPCLGPCFCAVHRGAKKLEGACAAGRVARGRADSRGFAGEGRES